MKYMNTIGNDIADGAVSFSTGTVSPGSNVFAGIVYVSSSDTATATVTITLSGFNYVLPPLDLSDAANQVPFVLPVLESGAIAPTFSVAVTGSSGRYNIFYSL